MAVPLWFAGDQGVDGGPLSVTPLPPSPPADPSPVGSSLSGFGTSSAQVPWAVRPSSRESAESQLASQLFSTDA